MRRLNLAALVIGLAVALGASPAWSQCSGQPASGRICGNPGASAGLPSFATGTGLFDKAFGATPGTILNRGSSTWTNTAVPVLGANGGTGGSITLNGSSTGSAVIGVKAAAGTVTFNLPVTNGSTGFALITDGSGNTSWSSSGSGTATSVGLALPGIFTVTGSPVTTSGTLTGTLNTQSANLVWAGPTTGAAATPTFRALVGADLPNPSASSLGGVQSAAAVTHQWVNSISTAGVPALSQPAFSDISGSITPAQCPNPSASTIGCVESYVAVAHQWINTVSTAGVPSSTQPAFTDIAGNATLSQLPSISNNSVLGNNSGGTAVPSALTATNVLDFIAATQGDVLYRNGSVWTALAPGTNGQVLTSGGAAANVSWTTVTGTGTVTSVATNNGITGGPITTTGTVGLATITAGTVLANVTGGSAIPIANTPSSILDIIGSTTGDILYRSSGSGWTVLAPGTNGQVLTQGATTPSWSNAGTLTNVTIAAGTGIGVGGTCNITTTGTCTVSLTAPVTSALGGTGVVSPTAHTIPINAGSSAQANTGVGTTGQALVSNGAGVDPSWKGGQWVLLNTLTASNSSSLSDLSSFTSTYNDYELVFENVVPVTNGVSCEIVVHTAGGFQSTGYLGTYNVISSVGTAQSAFTTFIPCSQSPNAGNAQGVSGSFRVFGPLSGGTQGREWVGMFTHLNSASAVVGGQVAAYWNSSTTIDGFSVFMSSGNISVGIIKVYGRL